MRLKPPVQVSDALDYLIAQAYSAWGLPATDELKAALTPAAEAMAAISAAAIPADMEPWLL